MVDSIHPRWCLRNAIVPSAHGSTNRAVREKAFLLLLGVVTLGFALILWPFRAAILWAGVLAIVFNPLYRRLSRRMPGGRTGAALLTSAIVLLVVICPLMLITGMLLQEALDFYQQAQSGALHLALPAWVTAMLERLDMASLAAVQAKISASLHTDTERVLSYAVAMWQDVLMWVVNFFVMLYLLFFLLRDGRALIARASRAIPLRRDLQTHLADRFATVIRATVKGDILTSALQGALGGLAFWALGIQPALIWAVAMAVVALLPAVGTAIIWFPVAIWLLATGAPWQGIALMAYGTFIIGLADNVVRPVLVGRHAKLPDYVVLLSTLGGIAVFGFDGIVVGPVIAAMFMAAWDTLSKVLSLSDDAARGIRASHGGQILP